MIQLAEFSSRLSQTQARVKTLSQGKKNEKTKK